MIFCLNESRIVLQGVANFQLVGHFVILQEPEIVVDSLPETGTLANKIFIQREKKKQKVILKQETLLHL